MPLKRIVVTTDFTEASHRAVDVSARLATKISAHVDLVHVYDPIPLGPAVSYPATIWAGDDFAEQMKVEAEGMLQEVAKARMVGTDVEAVALAAQNTSHGICDHANKTDADLIVVGTHGRTGMAHLMLGSVAERVIRHAPCSVLAVRPTVDPASFPRHVLVATDFSACSEAALTDAAMLARNFESRVTLLHVFRDAPGSLPGKKKEGYRRLSDVENQLHEALDSMRQTHFEARAHVDLVVSTTPALAIAQYAQRHDVDLVVMGTHGRTGLRRMLIGSVAEKTTRIAPCPVWTARPNPEHLEESR